MPQQTGHLCTTTGDTNTLKPCHRAARFTPRSLAPSKPPRQRTSKATVPQSTGPTAPHKAASAHYKIVNEEESEINVKKRLQESRSKAEGNCTFLQDSAASRKDSKHAQLLTLSLEKFHERFNLCVDENHHFQGVELRSWSLNPIERRSCRKVTVFQTEPVQTLRTKFLQASPLRLSLLKSQL